MAYAHATSTVLSLAAFDSALLHLARLVVSHVMFSETTQLHACYLF